MEPSEQEQEFDKEKLRKAIERIGAKRKRYEENVAAGNAEPIKLTPFQWALKIALWIAIAACLIMALLSLFGFNDYH